MSRKKTGWLLALGVAAMGAMPVESARAWVAAHAVYRGGYYGHATVVAGGYRRGYVGPVYHGGVYHAAWGCTGPGWYGVAPGAVYGLAAATPVVVNPVVVNAPIVVNQPVTYQPVGYVQTPVIGSTVMVLPQGSQAVQLNGVMYYNYADLWYKPVFSANGVYYVVVPQP